jgi:hypothetical protein
MVNDQPSLILQDFLPELAPSDAPRWLPGFVGPYPSTHLDKSVLQL